MRALMVEERGSSTPPILSDADSIIHLLIRRENDE